MQKLCAVIVTYNRKELLRRALRALQTQTCVPDEILVVNNASTDGTAEMLAREYPEVGCLSLPENLGGAGGYYYGLQWAVDHGFDRVMVMDDDGYPSPDCLSRLLAYHSADLPVCAPLVLSVDDPSRLAFTLFLEQGSALNTPSEARQVAQNGLIAGRIAPFNGVVIARRVIEQIGLPLKQFFLWGDEYEYFLRMKRAGIQVATVIDAHFFHPPDRMQIHWVNLLGRKFSVYYADHPLKDYLIVRNQAYIVKKYHGWSGWLAHVARYTRFYHRQQGLRATARVLTAAWHGARSDFSHHRKFL